MTYKSYYKHFYRKWTSNIFTFQRNIIKVKKDSNIINLKS